MVSTQAQREMHEWRMDEEPVNTCKRTVRIPELNSL